MFDNITNRCYNSGIYNKMLDVFGGYMKEKTFLVVTKNNAYAVEISKLQSKIEALTQFAIPYKVYYQIGNQWVLMLITVDQLLSTYYGG